MIPKCVWYTARMQSPTPDPRRRGSGLLPAVFVLAGGALFVLPFLRDPDRETALGADWQRSENDKDVAFAERQAAFAKANPDLKLDAQLQQATADYLGWDSPKLADLIDARRLENGQRVYQLVCVGCHGEAGDGGGVAARHLVPRPRNFRKGKFKFTSTATGERPVAADLFRTVTQGLAGSAMPAFKMWSEPMRWDAVEYVRYLAIKGEFEELLLDSAIEDEELSDIEESWQIVHDRWDPKRLRSVFPGVPESDSDAASVARGRALFLDTARGSCASCHGQQGRGDGPTAGDYKDDWGYPIRPRDFTLGVFRSGSEGKGLYLAIATGIKGTPMGSFAGMFKGEEIWDLVHYVQSLAPHGHGER